MDTLERPLAVVTGASRGIGLGIAKRLISDGYRVVGTATTPDGVDAIQKAFDSVGSGNAALAVNIASDDSVETFAKTVVETFGAPDLLVNNAGITRDNLFLRLNTNDWMSVIDTNLNGVYRMCRSFIKPMIKNKKGSIINISSVIGSTGNAGQCNYAAAKAGLEAFSRSLAQEIGSRNITVNCVAPGFIQTDMTDNLPESQKEAILATIPSKRLGHVDDIAGTVAFLASADARYITGQTIHVNGGMFMG